MRPWAVLLLRIVAIVAIVTAAWVITGWVMGCTFVHIEGSGNTLTDIGGNIGLVLTPRPASEPSAFMQDDSRDATLHH